MVAGAWLLLFRETFVPRFYAKLACVAVLVIVHAWIGRIVLAEPDAPRPPHVAAPAWPILAVLIPVLGILGLVLGKPDLVGAPVPDGLTEPLDRQSPFDMPGL